MNFAILGEGSVIHKAGEIILVLKLCPSVSLLLWCEVGLHIDNLNVSLVSVKLLNINLHTHHNTCGLDSATLPM